MANALGMLPNFSSHPLSETTKGSFLVLHHEILVQNLRVKTYESMRNLPKTEASAMLSLQQFTKLPFNVSTNL